MLKTEKVNQGFVIKPSSFEKGKVYINNHEITDYDSFMKVADENNVLHQRINTANIKLEILQKNLMKLLKTGIPIKDITDIQDVLSGEDIRRAVKELEETKGKSYDGYFTNYNIGGEDDE